MAFLNDDVLDAALAVLDTATATLHICSQEPTTLTEASSTYTLGNKSSLDISAPTDRAGGGREVTIASFADGAVTVGSATEGTHWAIVDSTRLLATNNLAASFTLNPGSPFSLAAFTIGIPDAVSQ